MGEARGPRKNFTSMVRRFQISIIAKSEKEKTKQYWSFIEINIFSAVRGDWNETGKGKKIS